MGLTPPPLTLLNNVKKCKIGFEGHTSAEVDRAWMKKNLVEVIHEVESQSGNDEQEEPIIHGFKHTASQYQSEKKILQILKRSLIWKHFWRPNSYFETVFPLQLWLRLQKFSKDSLSNSSSFISRSILWKLNLKSEFWSSCSHLVAGISSCPSFNFGPAPKAVLTLLSWLAIISANLGWLALAILMVIWVVDQTQHRNSTWQRYLCVDGPLQHCNSTWLFNL